MASWACCRRLAPRPLVFNTRAHSLQMERRQRLTRRRSGDPRDGVQIPSGKYVIRKYKYVDWRRNCLPPALPERTLTPRPRSTRWVVHFWLLCRARPGSRGCKRPRPPDAPASLGQNTEEIRLSYLTPADCCNCQSAELLSCCLLLCKCAVCCYRLPPPGVTPHRTTMGETPNGH